MKVKVTQYFGHRELYRFMPLQMFDTLSAAFASCLEEVDIDDSLIAELRRRESAAKIIQTSDVTTESFSHGTHTK